MKILLAATVAASSLIVGLNGSAQSAPADTTAQHEQGFNRAIFLALKSRTPHCHHGRVANCHYSDSVSVTARNGTTVWAEVHKGKYTVVTFP